MTTTENNVEDTNNGFGYGQLEQGQFQQGSNNKDYRCGCFSSLSLCRSYVGLGKDEVWKKCEANIGIPIDLVHLNERENELKK